jgi:hypothetical protein
MSETIWVAKSALRTTQIHSDETPALKDGQIRVRVESFAVTANNVTYAVIGDMFGYWGFFPAADDWGVVPMWGHAVIAESRHFDLPVGERIYGYLPMGTHLVMDADRVSAGGFIDAAPHRQPMSPFYNQYSRLSADPEHDPAREDARMIYGPLFKTGFLIEAMMRREGWFGAEQLVMTSASSKTSLALAHCAKQSSPHIKRVGLTSPGNVAFVEKSGLYDQVLPYDAGDNGQCQLGSVIVDFAGNAAVLRAQHEAFGDNLKYSCLVGATHVEGRGGSADPLPGPAPILFFAPDHATATLQELGPKGFGEAVGKSWSAFVAATDNFVTVDHRNGVEAARDAFLATLAGTADPGIGIVVRP